VSGYDFERAKPFITGIPRGRWSSYKDVAAAAGNPDAYMAAGNDLRASGGEIDGYWRVIHSDGSIADGFVAHSIKHPRDPDSARARLESEGIRFNRRGLADKSRHFGYEEWVGASFVDPDSAQSMSGAATEAAAVERNRRIVADVSARRITKGKPPLTATQEREMLERLAAERANTAGHSRVNPSGRAQIPWRLWRLR
jgi:alkylated DNA nucleotide flippase Atl1